MKRSRLQPKAVLWWGIILTAVGALLTIFLPNLALSWLGGGSSNANGLDQGFLFVLEVVTRLLAVTLPLLGVVLIGASIVMFYLESLLRSTTITRRALNEESRL